MDRALGAHPDKRSAAYESIFGRPSTAHHQYPRPPPSTSANYVQGYQQPPEYTAQNYYYQQLDPRYDATQAAYAQAMRQQYSQQSYAPTSYRQQPYYATQQQQHQAQTQMQQQQQHYPHHQYAAYSQGQYNHLQPPDQYARSVASSSHSQGIIVPQPSPQEPDPNIQAMMRSGMTPAQAYQAQVYSNGPITRGSPGLVPGRPVSVASSESRSQHSAQEHPSTSTHLAPLLGFQAPDTRLDLDFLGEEKSEEKKRQTDEGRNAHSVTPGPSGSLFRINVFTNVSDNG